MKRTLYDLRTGRWPLTLFLCLLLASWGAELWIGSRPLLVIHEGRWYFPVLSGPVPGRDMGQDENWETDWNLFQKEVLPKTSSSVLLMPVIPWGPHDIDLRQAPPAPPQAEFRHFLGTDSAGRDVLARLVYGFRIGIAIAFLICLASFLIATCFAILSTLGPPWFDFCLQRFLEIWSHLPFLYVLIAIQSLFQGGAWLLVPLLILFSWTQLSLTLRAQLMPLQSSDLLAMTHMLGFSQTRKAVFHLLPFLYPIFASLFPFALASTLSSLSALDTLGFALPSHWPSWGELLQEGLSRVDAPWLTFPVLVGLIVILTFTSLIGEASRKATHPRRASEYR